MALTESRPLFIRLTLPEGLEEALEGLAREVLRHQPDNIYSFAEQHFENLISQRSDEKVKKLSSEEEEEEQVSMTEEDDNITGKKALYMSEKLTSETPEDLAITDVQEISDEEKEDPIINELMNGENGMAEKNSDNRTSIDIQMPLQEQEEQCEDEEDIDIDLQDPEVEDDAAKIQAGFRDNQERKKLKDQSNFDNEENEIDIDLNDPEVEQAATKIQAGFKGHKARKEMKKEKETKNNESNKAFDETKSKIKNESVSVQQNNQDAPISGSIDFFVPEIDEAATQIQAGYKGYKTRRELHASSLEPENSTDISSKEDDPEEEEIDIDLEDPDVEIAATKIQAGFRGLQARKMVREKEKPNNSEKLEKVPEEETDEVGEEKNQKDLHKSDGTTLDIETKTENQEINNKKTSLSSTQEISIDLNDPEVEKAATTIQAGFKGHQTRKEMKLRRKSSHDLSQKIEETIDIDLTDPEVEKAATKIQAGFKGHKTRKQFRNSNTEKNEKPETDPDPKEEIDIDLKDPEVEKAATKIQAGFKGHQARKQLRDTKTEALNIVSESTEVTNVESKNKPANEEEIDIDLTDPEVEQAATKIQAGFKGHQTRKKIEQQKNQQEQVKKDQEIVDIDLQDPEVEKAATKIQAGFKGHKTRKDMKEKQKLQNQCSDSTKNKTELLDSTISKKKDSLTEEIDIDLTDPDVEKAATKIQAGFKGHQTRKQMKEKKEAHEPEHTVSIFNDDNQNKSNEEVDIDLTDPDVEKAATKIQAGFKGHQTRKQMKEKKEAHEPEHSVSIFNKDNQNKSNEEIDIDLSDPDVEKAATKIQAGFKGHQTRKQMKENKKETDQRKSKECENVQEVIDIDLTDPDVEKAATKIQAGFKGHQTRKQIKNIQIENDYEQMEIIPNEINNETTNTESVIEEIDIDLNDPEVEKAATKIQAGFKGHQARKELTYKKQHELEKIIESTENDPIDIDLTDPDVEMAATKIQAGFKGHQARKKLKGKELSGKISQEADELIDIDLHDPEVEKAATKIQAGFKGHQTRKQLKATNDTTSSTVFNNQDTKSITKVNQQYSEEVDIDLDDPEVEKAATKIQAGFKGHQTRKKLKENKDEENTKESEVNDSDKIDIDLTDPEVEKAATKIQAGFKGHKTRKEIKEKTPVLHIEVSDFDTENKGKIVEEVDIDLNDPEVERAATKIQAGFKGHQTRKQMKDGKNTSPKATNVSVTKNEEEVIDIDLNDPEVEKAATKIQAGFKGHQTRKQFNSQKSVIKIDEPVANPEVSVSEVDIDLNDPEVEKAATKIQAGFKGHKTRKSLKEKTLNTEQTAFGLAETTEQVDIDLTDPDVEAAATKIQAGFKGHKTRKEIKKRTEDTEKCLVGIKSCEESDLIDIDLNDPDVEKAATKIQAGFKGHQTRKNIRNNADNKALGETKESELHITQLPPGKENKECSQLDDLPDDGYNSPENTVESKDEICKKDDYIPAIADSENVENSLDIIQEPEDGHKFVSSLSSHTVPDYTDNQTIEAGNFHSTTMTSALAVTGSTVSAPVFAMFGVDSKLLPENKDKALTLVGQHLDHEVKSTSNESGFVNDELVNGVTKERENNGSKGHNSFEQNSYQIHEMELKDKSLSSAGKLQDSEEIEAATKIQAGFRGMQARKEIRELKRQSNVSYDDEFEHNGTLSGQNNMISSHLVFEDSISNEVECVSEKSFLKDKEEVEDGNEETIFEDWTILESSLSGEPTVLKPQLADETKEVLVRESSGKALTVGAIPFEHHPSHTDNLTDEQIIDDVREDNELPIKNIENNKNTMKQKLWTNQASITLYWNNKSMASQRVLLYLLEREIPHVLKNVNYPVESSHDFLEICPEGKVPVLKYNNEVLKNPTRIIHFLEEKVPVDLYQMMIPCTTNTSLYQKYIWFTSLIDQFDFDDILDGHHVTSEHYIGVVKTMEKLEQELTHSKDWLLGDMFSAADTSLAVLLSKFECLNLIKVIDEKPLLINLWNKLKSRKSLKHIHQFDLNSIDMVSTNSEVSSNKNKSINLSQESTLNGKLAVENMELDDENTKTDSEKTLNEDEERQKLREDRTWFSLW